MSDHTRRYLPVFGGVLVVLGAPALALATGGAARYDGDGVLGNRAEAERWLVNRARYAPEREADRIGLVNTSPGGSPNYDACEDTSGVNDFGSSPAAWANWVASKGPVAPNAQLSAASQKHSQDMAETSKFQHHSPSSTYYPLNSMPWERTGDEGYANQITGFLENLAYASYGSSVGYPPQANTPGGVHFNLFYDASVSNRGHRQAILNPNAREIGIGYQQVNGINGPFFMTYDYDTQDYARRVGNHFFTGTCFYDGNSNGVYDEGEQVPGIEIRLYQDGSEAPDYDESESSGGFAVPINGLIDGATVSVELVNPTGADVTLSIPIDFDTLGELDLAPGEARTFATFTQPADDSNIGFRNLEPLTQASINYHNGEVCVGFQALRNATYGIDSMDQPGEDAWSEFEIITAEESDSVCIDTGQSNRPPPEDVPLRIYRVRLVKN